MQIPKLHTLADVARWPVARVRIVQYLINSKLWVAVEGPEPDVDELTAFYRGDRALRNADIKNLRLRSL